MNNEQNKLITLFPRTVYKKNIGNFITDEEICSIKNNLYYKNNEGNMTYQDAEYGHSKVLDKPELSRIKKEINKCIADYIYNFLEWEKDSVKLKVISSWMNEITNKGQYHHIHSHPNSIISGVFYLRTLEDDRIMFYNLDKKLDYWSIPLNPNYLNAESWWLPVEDNDLLLFSSDFKHSVPSNLNNDYNKRYRLSLSFNTFFTKTEFKWNSTTYAKF